MCLFVQIYERKPFFDENSEETGFEPVIPFERDNGLANQRLQPLSHSSFLMRSKKIHRLIDFFELC